MAKTAESFFLSVKLFLCEIYSFFSFLENAILVSCRLNVAFAVCYYRREELPGLSFYEKIDKLKYFLKKRPTVSGDAAAVEEHAGKRTETEKDRKPSEISGGKAPMRRERIKIDLLIHDLKVPLAVIEAGVTAILKRPEKYGPVTDRQERVFQRALRNTKVIQALVNDALELGRSREGKLNYSTFKVSYLIENALVEIFDLTDAVASDKIRDCSSFSLLGKILKEDGLYLFVDEDLWNMEVRQDEAKVRQILRNLLGNALKYRKKKVELHVAKTDTNLVFSVKDDGDGMIPPCMLSAIPPKMRHFQWRGPRCP